MKNRRDSASRMSVQTPYPYRTNQTILKMTGLDCTCHLYSGQGKGNVWEKNEKKQKAHRRINNEY